MNQNEDRTATPEDVRELLDVAPVSDRMAAEISRRIVGVGSPTQEQRFRWFAKLLEFAAREAMEPRPGGGVQVHVQALAHGETPWTDENAERYALVQTSDDGDECLYLTDREHLAEEIRDHVHEEGWLIDRVVDLETGEEVGWDEETFITLHGLPPTARERADAALQIESLVHAGETQTLVDYLQQEQVVQLAEDFNEGRD